MTRTAASSATALFLFAALLLWKACDLVAGGCALHARGKEAAGAVLACQNLRKTGEDASLFAHTVEFDGFRARITQTDPVAVGAQVPVVYLPDHPATARFGRAGDPPLHAHEWLGVGLLLIGAAFFGWLGVKTGRSGPGAQSA